MRRPIPALALLLLPTAPAIAATLHVCPDGSGDYASLRAAVEGAESGDVLELCDGVFTGPDNVEIDVGDKSLTVRSLHGPDATTIRAHFWDPVRDEDHAYRAFIVGSADFGLEGVTIEGSGYTTETGEWGDGAAVRCIGGSVTLDHVRLASGLYHAAHRGAGVFLQFGSLQAQDCEFLQNHALNRGGAIYAEASWVDLARCHFSGNAACVGGGCVSLNAGSIADCVFENGGGGGCDCCNPGGNAISCTGPDVTVVRSQFRNLHDSGPSSIISAHVIEDCLFEDNDQEATGCVLGGSVIRNCTFRRNSSFNWGPADISYAHGLIEGCTFLDSHSNANPGEMRGAVRVSGNLVINRCTFARVEQGSAIFVQEPTAAVTVSNCILAFATAGDPPVVCQGASADLLTVSCTDVFGNSGGDWAGPLAGLQGAAGNLSADPVFCDLPGGDLRISSASPCAPAHSGNCGLIGALGATCGTTAIQPSSWGAIKSLYR